MWLDLLNLRICEHCVCPRMVVVFLWWYLNYHRNYYQIYAVCNDLVSTGMNNKKALNQVMAEYKLSSVSTENNTPMKFTKTTYHQNYHHIDKVPPLFYL